MDREGKKVDKSCCIIQVYGMHNDSRSDERYRSCLADISVLVQKTSAVMQGLEREQMRRSGYTPTQVFLLSELLLSGSGGVRMGELAARMSLDKSTLTRICDVLERKGLMKRIAGDAEDKRIVAATLTTQGRKVSAELQRDRGEFVAGILAKLPKGHVREVMSAFETVLDAMKV
jgi:MarR family transcriptional regulator, organic hydroperoxide resistance regulator